MQNRITALYFILLLSIVQTYSQQRVVDQLIPRLDTLPPSIEKVDVLIALARAYSYCGYADEKHKALEAAKNISNQIGYKQGIGQSWIFQNIQDFNEGRIDESLKSIEKAIAIAEEIESKDFKLLCDYNLAEFYEYGKTDYTKAIDILKKGLEEAGKEAFKKTRANAYRGLGISYMDMGDTSRAMEAFHTALDILESYKSEPEIDPQLDKESAQMLDQGAMNIGQINEYIGILYMGVGKLDLALQHSLFALDIYEEWEAPFFEGGVSIAIAEILSLQGKLDESLKYLRKAKDDFIQIGNEYFEAQANNKIGAIHAQLGDHDEAYILINEALNIFIRKKDSLDMMDTYGFLGDVALQRNNIDKAESLFVSGYQIAELLKDSLGLAHHAGSLGKIAIQKGNYELGLSYLINTLSIKETFGKTLELPNTLLDISSLFEKWNKPDSAIHYAQMALDVSNQTKATTDLKNSHLKLSLLHESAGDFESALDHYKSYQNYFQTLYSENAQQLLKEEQVRQNVEFFEKEKAAAEANAELLSQRNRLFIALGSTFLILFLLTGYLGLQLRSSKREIESKNRVLTDLNQTKDKFFGIIAHDLRSPMVALQSVGKQMEFYLKKERIDKVENLAQMVAQTTRHLDNLLDNLLNWALLQRGLMPYRPTLVSINEVIAEIVALFSGAIEAKGIQFTTQIPADIKINADERALQTTIRNLLSNAIKFTPTGGFVSISSDSNQSEVLIKVSDTGDGIPEDNLKKLFALDRKSTKGTAGEKGTGLGLILCKELVELNKGRIHVSSEVGKGSSFEFSIPKN